MPGRPFPAEEWFQKAREDVDAAELLLEHGKPVWLAGVHLQQALEKAFKGYLSMKGWRLRRIHDLVPLLNEAVTYDPVLEQFRELCQEVTQFYLEERYPGVEPSSLTREEVRKALEGARPLLDRLYSPRGGVGP